jgi:hypothetical protein
MSDLSDAVASHVLERGGDEMPDASRVLRFRPRNGWVGVLVFGSWGMVISVPLTMFALSGELPATSLPAVLGLACVGYGLIDGKTKPPDCSGGLTSAADGTRTRGLRRDRPAL